MNLKTFCVLALLLCTTSLSAQQPEMILVEGGDYTTSYGKQFSIESFYIDPFELTIGEFKKFVDQTGYVTQAEKDEKSTTTGGNVMAGVNWKCGVKGNPVDVSEYDVTPVCYVSYNDILAYCAWASKRLIREEEWEYAFSEGRNHSTFRYSGSNAGRRVAVNEEFEWVRTRRVGQKLPNALGIYDMSGNSNELCVVDKEHVIIRGGSFVDDPSFMTIQRAARQLMPISEIRNDHMWYFGFRLAKDI
jgi:formylglycine-generating enzyme required for sulfatase activity